MSTGNLVAQEVGNDTLAGNGGVAVTLVATAAQSGPSMGVADRYFAPNEFVELIIVSSTIRYPSNTITLPAFNYSNISTSAHAVSPNGRYLARVMNSFTNRPPLQVADLATGVVHDVETQNVWSRAVAFSPDGQYVAAVFDSASDALRFYRVGTWERVFSEHTFSRTYFAACRQLVYSPDGTKLGVAAATVTGYTTNGALWYIDLDTFTVESTDATLIGQSDPFYDCAFSTDGTKLGYARIQNSIGPTASWVSGPNTPPALVTALGTDTAYGCDFSPDGTMFAVSHAVVTGRGSLTVYDVATLDFIESSVPVLSGSGNSGCKFSSDGSLLFVHNGSVLTVINTTTWQIIDELTSISSVNSKTDLIHTPFYRRFSGRTFDVNNVGVSGKVLVYDKDTKLAAEVMNSSALAGFQSVGLHPRFRQYGAVAVSTHEGEPQYVLKGLL